MPKKDFETIGEGVARKNTPGGFIARHVFGIKPKPMEPAVKDYDAISAMKPRVYENGKEKK